MPPLQAAPNSDLWTVIVPLPVGSEVLYKVVVLGHEGGYRGACYEMMALPPASSEWNLKVGGGQQCSVCSLCSGQQCVQPLQRTVHGMK